VGFGSWAFHEPLLFNILTEAARICAESLEVPFCKVCRYWNIKGNLIIETGFGWHAGVCGMVVPKADRHEHHDGMGMLVAELISNSYEHAFTEAGDSIVVSLRQPEAGSGAVLTVRNNGSAFPEQPGSKRHSVGLTRFRPRVRYASIHIAWRF
jgi:hypothetical protein